MKMSERTADLIIGRSTDCESPLFHDKLLDTHFTPSLDTAAGIKSLLDVVEAEYAATDQVIFEAVQMVKNAIATIGAQE